MSQKTKQIIVVIIIIIIAFFGFQWLSGGNSSPDSALVADQTKSSFIDGQTILVLLSKLNQVTLDDSVFSNKVFTSLISFERPIQDQVIGRQNPFLPIGVDGSGIITPKSTSTSATTSRSR